MSVLGLNCPSLSFGQSIVQVELLEEAPMAFLLKYSLQLLAVAEWEASDLVLKLPAGNLTSTFEAQKAKAYFSFPLH